MPEITCATCGLPIDPSESTGQGFDGYMHLHVDRCVELLREENAALREDKARLDDMDRLRITVAYRGGMPRCLKRWTAKRESKNIAILHTADDPREAIDAARKEEAYDEAQGD